ncbi:O-antigen translocase [Escherichia coli]|uniref:O-antigen translocase n=1 Tax=Escherichia coli TaxID=562 RepID=UPI000FAFE144|nr:O-antigen translocase [Escherichia coli]EJQ0210281.1 O-antigen translocase [Escherichia coli]MBY8658496.1 O-antigen translocase [Escherichia coli]MIB34998.1 O-antigen translocase [Escherichia coli]HCJ9405826.1 O-antigen translocase [Escherichia coli]
MKMIKTSLLTGGYTLLKFLASFISNKVIAIYIGPSGVAILGNIQNYITLIYLFCGDLFKSAIIKYTAEDSVENIRIIKSAIISSAILNGIMITLVLIFSKDISILLTGSENYSQHFIIASFLTPFTILSIMIISYLNGIQNIKKFIILNIASSLIALIFTVFLTVNNGLSGAILAILTNQFLIFLYILAFNREYIYIIISSIKKNVTKESYIRLFQFSSITLIAILCSTLSLFLIRALAIEYSSITEAGEWQAAWTISQLILTLLTISLNTYFLPKISSIKNRNELIKEINTGIIIFIPFVILSCLLLYLFKEYIVIILYSKDFINTGSFFLFLLVGVIFKSISWFYGITFVAKAKIKITILTEFIFALFWYLTSWLFIVKYNLIGLTYSYATTSFLHMIVMFFLYKQENNKTRGQNV